MRGAKRGSFAMGVTRCGLSSSMFSLPFMVLEHVNILKSFRIFESHLVLKKIIKKTSMEILTSYLETIIHEPKFWTLFSGQFSRRKQNLQEENAGNAMKHKIVAIPKLLPIFYIKHLLQHTKRNLGLQGDCLFMSFTKQGKQPNNGFVSDWIIQF